MRLSIIVPVYNVKPYLARCVDSLCDQAGLSDYEIILVDDGSTDGSGDLCDSYAEKRDNIVVIHKENGGTASSRNVGLDVAKGEYVLFVDSDDYIKSNSLISPVTYMQNYQLDILSFNFIYVYGKYKVESNPQFLPELTDIMTGEQFLISNLEAGTMLMITPKCFFHREFLQTNRLRFKEGYVHEDEEWIPRVFAMAQRVMQIPDLIYAYCIRDNSISSTNHRKASLDLLDNCRDLKTFCSHLQNEQLKACLENNIAMLCLSALYKGRLSDQKESILAICDELRLSQRNQKKIKLLKWSPTLYLLTNDLNKKLKAFLGSVKKFLQWGIIIKDTLVNKTKRQLRRALVCKKENLSLENHSFSLISSNCNGGVITSELGEQFRSPTVNLWFEPEDFVRFISRLEEYLAMDMQELVNNFEPYPVGIIGDVTVYFMHYHSFNEAKQKWDERKKRVNFDNLFVMLTQKGVCNDETVAAFDALPYPNKVIFTAKEYPQHPSAVHVPKYSENGEVGILTDFVGLTKRKYDEYFDYVSWLNGKEYRI